VRVEERAPKVVEPAGGRAARCCRTSSFSVWSAEPGGSLVYRYPTYSAAKYTAMLDTSPGRTMASGVTSAKGGTRSR
jgi:hypothetical protein